MESISKGNVMTQQDVMLILTKKANEEHGAYVFRLFNDVFGDENPTKELNGKEVDVFLKMAIELASLKTRLNASKNDSEQKHYKCYGLRYEKQS